MSKTKKTKSVGKTLSAKQYQALTPTTAIFPKGMALEYLALGLSSEAGEVAGKAKKLIRGDYTEVSEEVDSEGKQQMRINLEAFHEDFWKEIGGVLWYISELCNLTDRSMEHIMADNIKILQSRQERGVLSGNGDNR